MKHVRMRKEEIKQFADDIFANLPPQTANRLVINMLKKYDILVRDCSDKKGLDGKQYLRIAVRSHEDNARLISAFKELEKQ